MIKSPVNPSLSQINLGHFPLFMRKLAIGDVFKSKAVARQIDFKSVKVLSYRYLNGPEG